MVLLVSSLGKGMSVEAIIYLVSRSTFRIFALMGKRSRIVNDKKECKSCKEFLPFSDFMKSKDGLLGLSSKCKKCLSEWQKNYRKSLSYEERNKYYKPLSKEETRKRGLLFRYGITELDFMEMLKRQDYKCPICLCKLENNNGHVDHCHSTNQIRGVLCRKCNLGLGHFKDNKESLNRAVLYLNSQVDLSKIRGHIVKQDNNDK